MWINKESTQNLNKDYHSSSVLIFGRGLVIIWKLSKKSFSMKVTKRSFNNWPFMLFRNFFLHYSFWRTLSHAKLSHAKQISTVSHDKQINYVISHVFQSCSIGPKNQSRWRSKWVNTHEIICGIKWGLNRFLSWMKYQST